MAASSNLEGLLSNRSEVAPEGQIVLVMRRCPDAGRRVTQGTTALGRPNAGNHCQ
jgi:hypothetical protein